MKFGNLVHHLHNLQILSILLAYDPWTEFPVIYLRRPLWLDLSVRMMITMTTDIQLLFQVRLVTVLVGNYMMAGPAFEVLRI